MIMWIRMNDNFYDVSVKVTTCDNGGLDLELHEKGTGRLISRLSNNFCALDNPGYFLLDYSIAWTLTDIVEFLFDNDIAIYAGAKVVSNTERAYVFRCNLSQLLKFDRDGTMAYMARHHIDKARLTRITRDYYDDQTNLVLVV